MGESLLGELQAGDGWSYLQRYPLCLAVAVQVEEMTDVGAMVLETDLGVRGSVVLKVVKEILLRTTW